MSSESLVVQSGSGAAHSGFRLAHLEVYNWGTFGGRVWTLVTRGENTLLTGDIGSGKSTLVDALTTLLVPPQKLAYNKAAGAEARERSLRSYVLGFFKSGRGEVGTSSRPIALRDKNSYSVILARFANEALAETVTLAQVFWTKEVEGQPARMLVLANERLSIVEHFGNFGSEINQLRKRLRRSGFEVYDSFPPYGAAFRRRFGIDNEQALDLFHQTVSMKSVGNLTDFVRQHMLEPFASEQRILALVNHFEDLNHAHEAVQKARAQIEQLRPLVADCTRHAALTAEVESLRACRDALRAWFARAKHALLEGRLAKLESDIARLEERLRLQGEKKAVFYAERDEVKRAIAANGGDRLERLTVEIGRRQKDMLERQSRAHKYQALAESAGLSPVADAESFRANLAAIEEGRADTVDKLATLKNSRTELEVGFRTLRDEHEEIERELASLRKRRSNIPARMLELRAELCDALGLTEDSLPFAGELLQVRDEERDWEGAIERVLHGFGLSMLVPDSDYPAVAQWVDATHLRGRLIYYRIRPVRVSEYISVSPESLVRKVGVKPDSPFYGWLEAEVSRRFDYACCTTLADFRREKRAITRAGQIKDTGERHEKDDRSRIDDRSRYVLGWSNEAKIAALDKERRDLEGRMQGAAERIANLEAEQSRLEEHRRRLEQLAVYDTFRDLEWQPLALEIRELEDERRSLEGESDVLAALQHRLSEIEVSLDRTEKALATAQTELGAARARHAEADRQRGDCEVLIADTAEPVKQRFAKVDSIVTDTLGEQAFTIESSDAREKEVRDALQARIDAEDQKIRRLVEKIVQAMQSYCDSHPLETREVDASIAAASEYEMMLARLSTDDLPRFEKRFKELLNENTIREVANFQSQLSRERAIIRERIETINQSLRAIDYNPGRYMVLEPETTTDAEIRDFQQDLRACTEGALTGSEDDAYSEAKFLQVKHIIERLRGREGTSELDARWTTKVTDVRNWFTFSASERWREDDSEHEHYTDSGGKSGGQKEKLAYTVLAASLAYQFGLEWGEPRPRSFRFVVIDEAFGRGSDESTRYGLELFQKLDLQLLVVTPLQKVQVIEPYVAGVGFVHNEDGQRSMLRNLTVEEYRAERAARIA